MIKYLIFDTETSGLNIISDSPFLVAFGLVDEHFQLVHMDYFHVNSTVTKDINTEAQFKKYLETVPTIVGHNIKFDLHMMLNSGYPLDNLLNKNYIDTSVLARLVINHDKQTDASFSTALKKLAVQYLGVDSADEERKLKAELSNLIMQHKQAMKNYFISLGLWDINMKPTSQTVLLNKIYNAWNKHYHNLKQFKIARTTFLTNNPAPTYEDCSSVEKYALTDIKLTHGLFRLWYPKVGLLKQIPALMRTNEAVIPLLLMERKGLTVDIKRLLTDRNAILLELSKTKIIDPRTNTELAIGQHAKLKDLYEYESGINLKSADKETRNRISELSPAAKAADYISQMNKYLTTYITGILNKLTVVNNEYKVFTQYNLAGTITGRLSSDFQQFPRDPLVLNNNHEINIRSWFIVPQGNKYMFYFDYSQLELRLQCEWTALISGTPDKNMARAFSPYRCVEKNGKYYLEEDESIEWEPTDLHAMTAMNAFPGVTKNDPDWKHYRSLGKRSNFAINYGAAAPKLVEALHVDFPTAKALVDGYRKTFAGVVEFGKWLASRVYTVDNLPNLFLRRYYSRNKHLLQNWLVQGSGADLLLIKLKEVYEYIKDKPHWNFMITVHDEIGFTCNDISMQQLKKEVKEIQQLLSYSLSAVNVISDIEYTTTCWSEKQDWEDTTNE